MQLKQLFFILLALLPQWLIAQYTYEPSLEFPYGRPNPDAPKEIKDFAPMIGACDCQSTTRKPDGSWNEPIPMQWTFKYIMNGTAVQDETLKSDGAHSGSIRQYNRDSSRWYVHYYSNSRPQVSLPAWQGNRQDGSIILYREQKAPNGMEGFYRLTFSDISESGYNWIGEWIDTSGQIVYPTWKIDCTKRRDLDFLVGTWKIRDKAAYEVWEKRSAYEYAGYAYRIKDDQQQITETLTIKVVNGVISYNATVPDQNEGRTIIFFLNSGISDALSFENPEHDFPKQIEYRKLDERSISVQVSGDAG
ncbi:MAG: hypothetical protein KDC80_13480, partial [Saprospiraceae bacterium]|nr:hypothetical protein [Saprospiraceae bacterium]